MKEEQKGKTLGQFREQVSSLEAEVTSLKHQLAGSKGRNKQLTQDVEKWKAYGKEADEMNEKRIAKIDEQEKVIDGLNSQVKQLGDSSKEQSENIKALRKELSEAKETIEHYKELPWYRRIFYKG